MDLTIAIASESPLDEQVYGYLASRILGVNVTVWNGDRSFNGCKSVAKLLPAFLDKAAGQGIKHAIVAVDNDGGSVRRPEHVEGHIAPVFSVGDDDGCRECWLSQAIPLSWLAGGSKACITVPVQTIETWLLAIRGEPMFATATPEQQYNHQFLKKAFYRTSALPLVSKIALAMVELQKSDALTTLAQRASFARFTARLALWP